MKKGESSWQLAAGKAELAMHRAEMWCLSGGGANVNVGPIRPVGSSLESHSINMER